MAAKAHGLDEECEAILEAAGVTEHQISLPQLGKPLSPPKPVVPVFKFNWPVKPISSSNFERALLDQGGEEEPTGANGFADEEDLLQGSTAQANGAMEEEEEEEADGWDMGEDVIAEVENDFVNVDSAEAGAGSSEAELWSRNSPIAADHIAGGSYDTAMQLLNRQVGAVNFKPLESRFEEIYTATRTYLPANSGLPPLTNYVRRNIDVTDPRRVLPLIPRDLESITANELAAGKNAMKANKLDEGVQAFKQILHLLMVNAVDSQQEVTEVS